MLPGRLLSAGGGEGLTCLTKLGVGREVGAAVHVMRTDLRHRTFRLPH